MKRYLLTTFLLVTLCFSQINKIPNFSFKMIDGKNDSMDSLLVKGPVLVDFWALWCLPCLKEMRYLNELHQKYSDKGFTILTINQDSPKSLSKVRAHIRSKKYTFLVALDPNQQIAQKLNAKLLPTTMLIAQNGQIIWRHQGYITGDEIEIEHQIIQALETDVTPAK